MVMRGPMLAAILLAVPGAPAAASECYGPVARTDTLWHVALRLRPDASIRPQRMMLALLDTNPQAFTSANVNALMAGSVLCFDPAEPVGYDDAEAVSEVRRHNREWRFGPAAADAGPRRSASPGVSGPAPSPPPPKPSKGARDAAPEAGVRGELAALRAAYDLRLARAEEEIERLRAAVPEAGVRDEVAALRAAYDLRLARAEEGIERLLRAAAAETGVRDELAALRSRLGGLEASIRDLQSTVSALQSEDPAASPSPGHDEALARLASRVSAAEDRIGMLAVFLEAELESNEAVRAMLLEMLDFFYADPSPTTGAPSRPMPTPAPQGHAQPMPTPAPSGGAHEPMPTPAPQGGAQPMPTPAPSGDAPEPMPTPAPQGGAEPMPTPAPSEGAPEPMPSPAPQGQAQSAPTPAPAPRQELETGSFIENAAARISRWIGAIGDLIGDLAGRVLD